MCVIEDRKASPEVSSFILKRPYMYNGNTISSSEWWAKRVRKQQGSRVHTMSKGCVRVDIIKGKRLHLSSLALVRCFPLFRHRGRMNREERANHLVQVGPIHI